MEKRWITQLGRRYRYLAERRREDVRDEASDCAIQSVIVQSINPDKLARTAEREARRRRRRNSRKESAKHKEGLFLMKLLKKRQRHSMSRKVSSITNILSYTVLIVLF